MSAKLTRLGGPVCPPPADDNIVSSDEGRVPGISEDAQAQLLLFTCSRKLSLLGGSDAEQRLKI